MEIGSTTCVAVSFDIVPLRLSAGMLTRSFHTRSGVPGDLLRPRTAGRGAGHADGAAQADLRVLLSILLKTRSGSNLRGRIDPRYIPGVTGPLLQHSASCSTESNRLHSTCIEPVTEEEQPAARTGDEASG
jgi:hypothetical protein